MPTLTLAGCAPVPLAYYLKAIGILRLLAESRLGDPSAKAAWINDELCVDSRFEEKDLVGFFLNAYQPTPVVAPWNGGSGFYKKDNREALSSIVKSAAPRFAPYRAGIEAAQRAVARLKLTEKPDGETKALLLQLCRNTFPDDALAWLDAVFVLNQEGPKYPPLLGTGGNDGRLEFTNNFMQRVIELIKPEDGTATSESERWLRAALFGATVPGSSTKAPVGQFFPGAAGGANGTSGFDAPSAVNPWDFVLMIEGALLFAAASVKRLESSRDGALAYPFCVRQAGVGYASAASADENEARCEIWMPLWSKPTSLPELRMIFGEGRAQVGGRAARNGVDFARAAVSLGVDRGIGAFQRYGFQVRNGLAYFATPLSRVAVQRNGAADLLSDLDHWYERLRQKAGAQANPAAPAAVARGLNGLERAILELCRDGSSHSLQGVLVVLGRMECLLSRSLKWSLESHLHPLCGLRPEWYRQASSNTSEYRLAAALAGMRGPIRDEDLWFRQHLEPLEIPAGKARSRFRWAEQASNNVVWHSGHLGDVLNEIIARRLLRFQKSDAGGWPDRSPVNARLEDITSFIEGRTDDALLADLIWGLSLLDWQNPKIVEEGGAEQRIVHYDWREEDAHRAVPSSFYALLKLCFQPRRGERRVPIDPAIHNRARAGNGDEASKLAARRLRSSGFPPLVDSLPVASTVSRRTAAALLFPISPRDMSLLEKMIINQPEYQNT